MHQLNQLVLTNMVVNYLTSNVQAVVIMHKCLLNRLETDQFTVVIAICNNETTDRVAGDITVAQKGFKIKL